MARKTVLAMATAGALALVACSMSSVPALATGVQLNSGLSGLAARNTDDANLVLVGRKGDGGGGGGEGKGVGRGDGGGGKQGMARHEGGGKSYARRGGGGQGYVRQGGGGKSYARHGGAGKSYARRGGGGRTVIVYRSGHRYWHDRQIWWWGPLVYTYDPCIRWVRFCPGCAREPINICY
jgi:hypothetical protein